MSTQQPSLPTLRRDLRLEAAGVDHDGMAVATVIDPVRANYFRLHWPESVILPIWKSCKTRQQLCDRVKEELDISLTDDDIGTIAKFLHHNQLTETDDKGGWQRYLALAEASKHSLTHKLVHNYLFFRFPLVHPQAFLETALPRVEFLFSRLFTTVFLIIGLTGCYLISRQWADFSAMFTQTEQLPSLTIFAVVLLLLKVVHEFGHAITTVRAGCRVPSMGVAFMLGAPVLYTDTTDSWRLPQRSDRLKVVVAGVGAEMIVAGLAVFLWPFLLDGLARHLCFAIMTTSIVTTLLINLNPFMRYDGYFALSDYLEVPNLQPRSFALANWKMRELLFSLGQPPPETFAPRLQIILIAYAWMTWVYRLVLFAGIAVIVYAMSFKALGIALGLFEIVVFIVRPVAAELKEWWAMRALIAKQARLRPLGFAAACMALILFWPWMHSVDAPALLIASNEEPLHVAEPAQISAIHVKEGQAVEQGGVLFETYSPDLNSKVIKARLELRSLEARSAQLTSLDDQKDLRLVVMSELKRAREQVASLEKLQSELTIRAPFSGTIVDLDQGLHIGVWQSPDRALATLISTGQTRARGVIRDTDLARLQVNAVATFIPEDVGQRSVAMRLTSIAAARDSKLPELALADVNGGSVETIDENGEQLARYGSFEVSLTSNQPAPHVAQRGFVQIEATATSPFALAWRQVARVLVREQGF
jgi:putative peptide zinc metalloprotease protein